MIHQSKLSADPTALILGIVSLFILLFVCCCGLMIPVSLALAIVGWVLAHKSLNEYQEHPEVFSQSSRSNVNTAKIICIVSTVLNGLLILVFSVGIFFFQSDVFESFRKEFEKKSNNTIIFKSDSTANDTLVDDSLYKEEQKDTVRVDSVEVKL